MQQHAPAYAAHGGRLKDLITSSDSKSLNERIAHLPRVNLRSRQLYDLELLLNGGFSPLEGFMNEEDYRGVVDSMRLADGTLWPMPIVLDLSNEHVEVGEEVVLCDPYGTPLAILTASSVYRPNKEHEAKQVFGTTDRSHFGVRYLFEEMGSVYIGGHLEGVALPEYHDFRDLRRTPSQVRDLLSRRGWERVVGFQTRNPLHRAHFDLIRRVSRDHDAYALLHPVVGMTKDGDIDYVTRVKAYKALHENYMKDFAELSLLPLAMRMGGPREALWHAIIRKNYGCTHFIIGRDHAGPKDTNGEAFYGDYDAQELVREYEGELGIEVVPMKKVVYAEEEGAFIPEDEIKKTHTIKELSGTEFRRRLAEREEIPEWFSFPEVIDVLRRRHRSRLETGFTLFFTGLSGAGKSTIARVLEMKLRERTDRGITLLDGDIVRQNLSKGLGFSKEDRNINIERIGFVAAEITKHGGVAVCSAIAPYAQARQNNRERVSEHGPYIEIYVATPLDVCKERDVKGLYEKAEQGLIRNFTGVSDPYEEPESAEVVLDTTKLTPEACADMIIEYLENEGLIST